MKKSKPRDSIFVFQVVDGAKKQIPSGLFQHLPENHGGEMPAANNRPELNAMYCTGMKIRTKTDSMRMALPRHVPDCYKT